jgi:hypothetical protein
MLSINLQIRLSIIVHKVPRLHAVNNLLDYSDSLLKKRIKRGGLLANQTDFEMQATGVKEESPAQRFHRLQYEVKSFLQEMEQKKVRVL